MAVNTPVFVESYAGRLLVGGLAGDCVSLMRWKLFLPKNAKRLDNYCVFPMSAVNVTPTYVQVAGGWDTANPPHKSPYFFVYGTLVVLYLGINSTTHGYLGTFLITDESPAHSLIEGADFEFGADLQGTLTRFPA